MILELPRRATSAPPVPPPGGPLTRASRATGTAAILAGTRAVVRVRGFGGLDGIEGDTRPVTGAVRLDGPPAANAVWTPRSRTAERTGAEGTVLETVLVPERLPGAVVQWVGSLGRTLTLTVVIPDAAPRLRIDGALLRWARAEDAAGGVLQLLGPGSEEGWTVHDEPDQVRVTAPIRPGPDAPSTLLALSVGDDGRMPAMSALASVRAHRRRDDLEPDEAPGVRLTSDEPELDEGVAWARARLRARDAEGTQPALVARGALAAGEWDVALAALERPHPSLARATALAEWVAWTGRPGPLLAARPALDPLLAEASPATRRAIAEAAEACGDKAWAEALRRPPPRRGSALSLPSVGRGAPERDPFTAPFRNPLPDAAVEALRTGLVRLGAGGGDSGDLHPAEALLQLVRGLLGVDPDAAYGRLGVAPWLPDTWTGLDLSGLRLRDASLRLGIRRDGLLHRFTLVQEAGATPVTWILAPRLPGQKLTACRIDGEPATVDSERIGPRIRPRVQVAGAGERVVEFEVDG